VALIAVDMTPLLPGGENGGVKLLALELLKGFQNQSPEHEFLLLTTSGNHQALAFLDGPRTRRLCVIDRHLAIPPVKPGLPARIVRRLRRISRLLRRQYRERRPWKGPLSARGVDALFCPFTAPTYAEPKIPVISIVCDLQHKDYPQFFTPEELDLRESIFSEVGRRADAIICISESTRASVIQHLKVDPDRTRAIPVCIQSRLAASGTAVLSGELRELHIDERPYMFYPANFWPHKNHLMLVAAYGMFAARNPDCRLDLVFTGALDEAQRDLKHKVRCMGLERQGHFLGYLPEAQVTAVWKGCSFLIFPSLYEGFGIPVLEAMQFGKPVVCSKVTSLPEVAGDAALYFDPRKPFEMVQCLEKMIGDEALHADLIRRGDARLSSFRPEEMVKQYLQCIEAVI